MDIEQLTIIDIIKGLSSESIVFKSHRLALIQVLINRLAISEISTSEQEKEGEPQDTSIKLEDLKLIYLCLFKILKATNCTTAEGRLIVNAALCALTNATISIDASQGLLDLIHLANDSNGSDSIQSDFRAVVETFLQYNPQLEPDEVLGNDDWEQVDEWQHMSSLLCNLSQLELGRKLLLRQSDRYMERLVFQVRSKNIVRRRGAIGCIRSCLFDADIHWWMLNEVKVLTPILIPLVVNTPFLEREMEGMDPVLWMMANDPNTKHEEDLDIMKMLLECIVLLCQKRGLREELRKMKVYPVVKNLDLKIEDEGVSNVIYEIVNFLMGDEDPDTPIEKYEKPSNIEN